jgi:hypothetical protein
LHACHSPASTLPAKHPNPPARKRAPACAQVIDGLSERGGHPVVRMPMKQWMLRITAYADRLLSDLDSVDWADSIKEMQRNWIGRSEVRCAAPRRAAVAAGAGLASAGASKLSDWLFLVRGLLWGTAAPRSGLVAGLRGGVGVRGRWALCGLVSCAGGWAEGRGMF